MLICKYARKNQLLRRRTESVSWLFVLGIFALLLRASDVQAYRIIVRYDATDQPPDFTQLQVVRLIQSVMREYETLGAGKVVLEWGGVSTNRVLGTGNIAIFWDTSLDACASMQRLWGLPLANGALRLHPGQLIYLNGPPNPNPTLCSGLRAAIVHELAHYFEQQGHPAADSVLAWGSFATTGTQHESWMQAGIANYRQDLHLWNSDFGSFPCGVPNSLSFCPHPTSALVRDYNPISTAVATMSQFPVPKPVTTTLATGGPGNSYTLAASNAYTIWVNQGNGSSWSLTSTINEGNFHRMCFATAVNSNEMLMAWPNRTEEAIPPWFYNFQVGADNIRAGQIGARSIRYTLSHDGGHTWDPVSNMSLPDVLTRTGVSCGWNPGRSAFVLAWQSATTDNVEFAESIPFGWRRVDFGLPAIPVGALRTCTEIT